MFFPTIAGGFRFPFLLPFPQARSLSAATEANAAKEAKEAMEARLIWLIEWYQCP